MCPWRVASWSSEAGTGLIESDAGKLPIERSGALVDDFIVGEEVNITLEDIRGGVLARAVAPVRWRENATRLEAPHLPTDLAAKLAQATALLGPGVQIRLASATGDVVRLDLEDPDWSAPLGSLEFQGVAYLKLPSASDDFTSLTALPWPVWRDGRTKLLRYWALDAVSIEASALVFRLEPQLFTETAGYIIAESVTVSRRDRPV